MPDDSPTPAQPPRPLSARPAAPVPEGQPPRPLSQAPAAPVSQGEPPVPEPGVSKVPPASPGLPTPVRQVMDSGDGGEDGVEPDADGIELVVDGTSWAVRVMGRSRGGPSAAPADLLLVGFFAEDGAAPPLEALVAARSLAGLSEKQVLAAFRDAVPPPDPERPKTLFQGAAERRPRKG